MYTIDENFMTVREAAEYLGVSIRDLLYWRDTGRVRGHLLANKKRWPWYFLSQELDAAILQGEIPLGYLRMPLTRLVRLQIVQLAPKVSEELSKYPVIWFPK